MIFLAPVGVEVATGFVVDIHTFDGMPRHECRLPCPACGKDAFLGSILTTEPEQDGGRAADHKAAQG
jgi:hypothetical protein